MGSSGSVMTKKEGEKEPEDGRSHDMFYIIKPHSFRFAWLHFCGRAAAVAASAALLRHTDSDNGRQTS